MFGFWDDGMFICFKHERRISATWLVEEERGELVTDREGVKHYLVIRVADRDGVGIGFSL